MKLTAGDLEKSVGGVLTRFGIDKKQAREARRQQNARIRIQEKEQGQQEERYHAYFLSGFTITDLSVEDVLMPTLTVAEQSIYRRLYRLSFGYGRTWCRVSLDELGRACNMSSRATVRNGLRGLMTKQCVKIIEDARQRKPPVYRVYLPCEIPEFSQEGMNANVVFIKEKTDIHEIRRTINSHPDFIRLKSRPLKFDSLKQLSRSFPDPKASESSRLNSDRLTDKPSSSAGLQARKDDAKPSINNSINKDTKNSSLSPRDIVYSFYRGIGQNRIAKQKREKAEKDIEELTQDRFSSEDIQFAVEWTLKNAREELYDFSIIKHTIGQAMAARKKVEEEEAKRREREKAAAQKEAEERRIAEEEAQIKAYKESLDANERARLRERAEAEIRSSGQYKKEFITEYLIEAKENELIRNHIESPE
jgi:hypothetical protein